MSRMHMLTSSMIINHNNAQIHFYMILNNILYTPIILYRYGKKTLSQRNLRKNNNNIGRN